MLMMDTKGIMLDFLVTVVITIVLFVPALFIVNKAFTYSDQARESFDEFVALLQNLPEEDPSPDPHIMVLKIDDATMMAYFEPHQNQIDVFIPTGPIGAGSQAAHQDGAVVKPSECTPEKACLCLIREFAYAAKPVPDIYKERCIGSECGSARIQHETTVTPISAHCVDFEKPLLFPSRCSVGTPHLAQGYSCTHGFIIERGVFREANAFAYFTAPRRVSVTVRLDAGDIIVST
jgi:hypothetical protein